MHSLYLDVRTISDEVAQVPIETGICLLALHYLNYPKDIELSFVHRETLVSPCIGVSLNGVNYSEVSEIPSPSSMCQLPALTREDGISCVAGLCAVLRQVVKTSGTDNGILGFRKGCLVACAEFSMWTKFCEIDLPSTCREVLSSGKTESIPVTLARFESHMGQPTRIHNIGKLTNIQHTFVEGPSFLLSDIIIAVPMYVIVESLQLWDCDLLPLTLKWLNCVMTEQSLKEVLLRILPLPEKILSFCRLPEVEQVSLYKSDPKRYKPADKIFTQQCDIDESLSKVAGVTLVPFGSPPGSEIILKQKSLLLPDVPQKRLVRKMQQLVNLTKAACFVSHPGDLIVDFCAGSGHLGLILARCLPDTKIVLLDNKETSLDRAREKVSQIGAKNVYIVQANLDYFSAPFRVGVSLHACGVASDLVIHKCLQARANFVICPCCYGGIQRNHIVTYPLSQELKDAGLSEKNHLVLSHCADQAGTVQGEKAMQVIDSDRCLAAKREGYRVYLSKLRPPACTPRNNLITAVINE